MSEFRRLVIDDTHYKTRWTRKFETRKPYAPVDPRRIRAFIPGIIENIQVKPHQRIKRGESLCVLEAMKMRNEVVAPTDGVVLAVRVTQGQMVVKDQVLIELE